MATAEEILATMADDTSEYEDFCLIDTDARTISISEKLKIVGVESDEDVVRRTFRMPWKVGENDLSTFAIRINYLNAQGEGDIYIVDDMQKSGDDMTFSWLLSRYATKYRGSIRFVVCMILFDGSEIDKEWNTTLAEFTVLEGLETSSQIEEDNPDAIENILLRLNKLESTGGVSDEQIGNAVNDYLTKNPIQPGATQEQAEQIEANKKAIEELQQNGAGGGITEETDPTVPAWAKADTKPKYTADEVGALPNTTVIPTVPNALKNPYPLTINGVAYDGSEAKTINIQASGGGESVSLDTTLTQYGMAADAGAVGNALAQEKDAREEELNELKESIVDEVHVGKTEPTDPNVKVWIDPEGEATIPCGGTSIDDSKPSTTSTYSSSKIDELLSEQKEANAKQDAAIKALEQAGGIVTVEPAEDDAPIVFFGGDLPQTKTDTVMPFKYVSKSKTVSGYVETKAQGNSSMNYAKKNQTVKMYADEALEDSVKVDFKGWGAQKKHVYKANWIDLTHARNIVSAQLWGDVVKGRANYLDLPELLRTSPNQGAVDGFPALVYANGVYQGRYTINIPKDAWMANMDDSLDEHCILCAENYASGCFRAEAKIDESDWTDEIHDTVPTAIKTRWNAVINFVMNSTDEEFKANLSNYFYVDSLIDYLLFGLAICHLDGFGKNQIYMTYDGQKWIASMYDMDSTWGLYWDGSKFVATDYARTSYEDYTSSGSSGKGNLLYIRLEKLFYEEIQARWAELKTGALSYSNIMTRFERFIGIVPPHIVKEDYASTTGSGKFTGIPSQNTNHIQQIRSFASARLAWTDEYVAALDGSGGEDSGDIPGNEDIQIVETLYEDYSPSEASFSKTAEIDWENEMIFAEIDLSTCTSFNQNVLSVGLNIAGWTGNNIHMYYPSDDDMMNIAYVGSSAYSVKAAISDKTSVRVIVGKNGVYVDGTLYAPVGAGQSALGSIINADTVQVGSAEGSARSTATYKQIAIAQAAN